MFANLPTQLWAFVGIHSTTVGFEQGKKAPPIGYRAKMPTNLPHIHIRYTTTCTNIGGYVLANTSSPIPRRRRTTNLQCSQGWESGLWTLLQLSPCAWACLRDDSWSFRKLSQNKSELPLGLDKLNNWQNLHNGYLPSSDSESRHREVRFPPTVCSVGRRCKVCSNLLHPILSLAKKIKMVLRSVGGFRCSEVTTCIQGVMCFLHQLLS